MTPAPLLVVRLICNGIGVCYTSDGIDFSSTDVGIGIFSILRGILGW